MITQIALLRWDLWLRCGIQTVSTFCTKLFIIEALCFGNFCYYGYSEFYHSLSYSMLFNEQYIYLIDIVYPDGKVCISILHPPGTDEYNNQESADERWRPILGVESIILSVISMLNDPNISSPANIDAAVEYRDNYDTYKKKVRKLTIQSVDSLWAMMRAIWGGKIKMNIAMGGYDQGTTVYWDLLSTEYGVNLIVWKDIANSSWGNKWTNCSILKLLRS